MGHRAGVVSVAQNLSSGPEMGFAIVRGALT
jgi:hypothetical protein